MKRFLLATALAACSGSSATAPQTQPAVVSSAPKAADFTLTDTDGNPVALHDLVKRGPVILAFFPKAFTGG